ncbi:MAG: hypothetical protein ACKVOP_13380 [Sphingomonadaceae bacterium]
MMMPHALPPGFSGPFAVNLILTGAPDILQTTEFAGTMAGFVERGTATYLDLPGAPGMFGHQTLLNPILGSAIAARDLASVKALIWDVYTGMKNAPTRPIRDDELANARTTGGVAEAQT